MLKEKRSFFERLTGGTKINDSEEKSFSEKNNGWMEEESDEGQLAVDVYQNPSEIIIKTMAAGVRPEDLDITITRDMVVLKGKREGDKTVADENYFFRELYWGSFSRTIMLPQEIEPEEAEAIEKHGLLIIKLPKINKDRQTKLKIKTI